MAIPRGPIYQSETSAQDIPQNYARDIISYRDSMRSEAIRTAQLNQEIGEIGKYIDVISGKHWGPSRPRYKSKFVTNRTGKARVDLLSMLTDTRPVASVLASDESFNDAADVIDSVIRYEYLCNDHDLTTVRVADIAAACGTAFCKIGAASPGMMKLTPCGADQVFPIQPGFHIQESTGVMYRTWKSANQLKANFGARANNIEREATVTGMSNRGTSTYAKPGNMDEYTWNGLAPAMQRQLGRRLPADQAGGANAFGSIEWQEYWIDDLSINESRQRVLVKDQYLKQESHNWWYWVEPGQRLFPRKRLMCFAGNRLMYDGPSPFWHGLYPFSTLQFNPVFWSFYGLSLYRDLMPLNTAINEIVAGILDMIKKILNPVAVTREGAVPPAAWREFYPDMPGSKLRMGMMSNPAADIQYLKSPDIPAYVFQVLSQFLGPEFDKQAGLLDMNELSRKEQVPGGSTINIMQDSMQTAIRLRGRYLETFVRDTGLQEVSNVIQFYTLPQRLRMLGPKGLSTFDLDYKPNTLWPSNTPMAVDDPSKFDHWKRFAFRVEPGSMHSGAEDRAKQEGVQLLQLGAIPRQEVWRRFKVTNPTQLKNEMIEEAQIAAQIQQQSQPPDPKMVEQQKLDQIDAAVKQIAAAQQPAPQPQPQPMA